MIDILKLQKTFQDYQNDVIAIKEANMKIKQGEIAAVVGPSGSGKTTLLNCIGGLEVPTSGTVMVDDKDVGAMSERERQTFRREVVGSIFQDFRLLDQYSVMDNIMLPLLPYQSMKQIRTRTEWLLDKLELKHRKNHLPQTLSGGEKQRTAIARALLNEPTVILCDEPTGNLDEENRDRIVDILKQLKQEGKTIILVTHDPQLAKESDRIFSIRGGTIEEAVSL